MFPLWAAQSPSPRLEPVRCSPRLVPDPTFLGGCLRRTFGYLPVTPVHGECPRGGSGFGPCPHARVRPCTGGGGQRRLCWLVRVGVTRYPASSVNGYMQTPAAVAEAFHRTSLPGLFLSWLKKMPAFLNHSAPRLTPTGALPEERERPARRVLLLLRPPRPAREAALAGRHPLLGAGGRGRAGRCSERGPQRPGFERAPRPAAPPAPGG